MKTVVIRHILPDGSHHFDWMIARDPRGTDPLVTFRMDAGVDKLTESQSASALRIADHRAAYLEYEGPVSGDRGEVRRESSGAIVAANRCDKPSPGWRLAIAWHPAASPADAQHLLLVHEKGDDWRVTCVTMA